MNKFSKILKAAAVFTVSALVLAACAGDREIESFRIVGPEPEFADGILTLNEGESAQLGGRVTFDNETTDAVLGALIDWSSSNPDAVSVNETGVVTAHRSEEHTSELQSRGHLVCRLLLEKKKHVHHKQL